MESTNVEKVEIDFKAKQGTKEWYQAKGYMAYRNGVGSMDNPYEEGSHASRWWLEGFNVGFEEDIS